MIYHTPETYQMKHPPQGINTARRKLNPTNEYRHHLPGTRRSRVQFYRIHSPRNRHPRILSNLRRQRTESQIRRLRAARQGKEPELETTHHQRFRRIPKRASMTTLAIISLIALLIATLVILAILIGTIYAVSEWTQNFWIICLWIFACFFIAHFIIEFTEVYADAIKNQTLFKG